MKTLVDVHTHTIASGHAFSTMSEMIAEAQRKGVRVFGITEHGDAIPGSCHPIYFRNYHVVPRQYGDLRLLLGAELNILDTEGNLDLREKYYRFMDFRIAGIHGLCWKGGTKEENTDGVIAAMRNPWVQIISHPGDGTAELDFERLVLASKETGTLLEINNSSLKPERNKEAAEINNREILLLCKKHGVPVILGSDAHITFDIGNYNYALELVAETGFPEELILNDKPEEFLRRIGRSDIII